MNQLIDYYRILGVPYNATAAEIRSSYLQLAKQFHPDINRSWDASARMQLINEAYEILGDALKKSYYDYIFLGYREVFAEFFESAANTAKVSTQETPVTPDERTVRPIHQPGVVQQEISKFVVFLIKWQGRFQALLLLPIMLAVTAVAAGDWESGALFFVVSGVLAFVLVMMIVVSVFFQQVGVDFQS